MSKEIYVAVIMQANTFADHEFLLKNKYFLEYRAGSKNNNNKNRTKISQHILIVCCINNKNNINMFTLFFFYFSLVYEIIEPPFSPLVQQVFISCVTHESYIDFSLLILYPNSCFMVTLMQEEYNL